MFFSQHHRGNAPRDVINKGTIGCLGMSGVYAKAEGDPARGSVVSGPGVIPQQERQNVFTVNVAPDLAK